MSDCKRCMVKSLVSSRGTREGLTKSLPQSQTVLKNCSYLVSCSAAHKELLIAAMWWLWPVSPIILPPCRTSTSGAAVSATPTRGWRRLPLASTSEITRGKAGPSCQWWRRVKSQPKSSRWAAHIHVFTSTEVIPSETSPISRLLSFTERGNRLTQWPPLWRAAYVPTRCQNCFVNTRFTSSEGLMRLENEEEEESAVGFHTVYLTHVTHGATHSSA